MARVGVVGAAKKAQREDLAARRKAGAPLYSSADTLAKVRDSLQNFQANLGIGTDNLSSATGYGFNPITRVRILLEWIYRGSWIGGVAVNSIADDMTRAGVELRGDLDPDKIERLERCAVAWKVWKAINATLRWSRLYGGALGVVLIDGQDTASPLRLETVGRGSFRGLLVLDRWMVDPSLQDLVTELGPDLGNPKYYTIIADSPALRRRRIHYSRCLRLEGVELPFQQKLMENLWGISVLERLYDRLQAFDAATTGVSQLIYKAYLRVIKINNMREIIAAGGDMEAGLIKWVDMMRRFQSIEGITMIDSMDDAVAMAAPSFSGLAEALVQLGQQIGGALEMPMTKLFGQSPTGMNATGESDLRMYEDGIKQRQEQLLKVPVTTMYRVMAASEGVKLNDSFSVEFRPIRTMTDMEKAQLASLDAATEMAAYNAGVTTQGESRKDLRQSSKVSGRFTNISNEDSPEDSGAAMMREQTETQLGMEEEQHAAAMSEPKTKPNGKEKTQ